MVGKQAGSMGGARDHGTSANKSSKKASSARDLSISAKKKCSKKAPKVQKVAVFQLLILRNWH